MDSYLRENPNGQNEDSSSSNFRQVVFVSVLLAFVLSVFEFFFTYYYLIPSIHRSIRKRFRGLAHTVSDDFRKRISDPLLVDAANSYITDFQETMRYNLPDVVAEETHFFNFERVQFSLLLSGSLGALVVFLRFRWGERYAPLTKTTLLAVVLSAMAIGLFQLVFFHAVSKKYKTWNDTELLAYALNKVKPVMNSHGRIRCPGF